MTQTFVESCVDFEVAHLSILMVRRFLLKYSLNLQDKDNLSTKDTYNNIIYIVPDVSFVWRFYYLKLDRVSPVVALL